MTKTLILGDLHLKNNLSYSEYISDGRVSEKKEILDFIIDQSEDCQHVVFLGDFFDAKNNSSQVNKDAVSFIERFGKKDVYIISGNHSKKGDGTTAIDFLAEVKNKNWHIFTKLNSLEIEGKKIDFLPYMLSSELKVENYEEATNKVMKDLKGGDILFAHHAITGTTFLGIKTDDLREIVLPREKLEAKYKKIFAGHIHVVQESEQTIVTGNVFTDVVGDIEKFIWKIDDSLNVEKIKVPAREIHKLKDPTSKELQKIPKNSIVKVVLTDKKIDVEEIEKELERFEAHLFIFDYPNSRKKMKIEEGAFDFSLPALLKMYSEAKNVDLQKLLKGLELLDA